MVINTLLSQAVRGQPEPEVGMGVTFLSFSDRAPGTIYEVQNRKGVVWIGVRGDNYKRTDKNGMSEMQTYEFTQNPEGPLSWFKRLENGMWQAMHFNEKTKRYNKGSQRLRIGERDKYHDFSF